MSTKKNAPVIGTVFSSDSSDENESDQLSRTTASEPETKQRHVLKVNLPSGDESIPASRNRAQPPISDGTVFIAKTQLGSLQPNTIIQYEKNDGKIVKSKYFKKVDYIANSIVLGFYTHDKRNYTESLSNIKSIVSISVKSGGANPLSETILLKKDQWKNIRRDMIISYEKKDHEFVYKSRFNTFIKGSNGITKMSLTSERGFSYVANPDKMINIYRHVTSNDKTLTYILESLQKVESRLATLETKFKKM